MVVGRLEMLGKRVLAFNFVIAVAGCGKGQPWGSAVVVQRFREIQPTDIRSVKIYRDNCKQNALTVESPQWPGLLARLRTLASAETIGTREPWETYRIIVIDAGSKGTYDISVATRASLRGLPIAIVEGGHRKGEFLDFFQGDGVRRWLNGVVGVAEIPTSGC